VAAVGTYPPPLFQFPMFTPREAATLLAALQYWSEEMSPHPDVMRFYPPLDRFDPLSADEIEGLRQQLNQFLSPERSPPA